ncbi:uncharacterized protein LOC126671720 [Mercurialis annua]|uniref:uncharacterized protein LOC126671720 n=1 Tax=Mercurialis annua TaxID=3986 RepID=UPI00215F65AA|nr:uncharacterized protein LOC126671720 [Mercurialis annua]
MAAIDEHPWLVFFHEKPDQFQSFFSLSEHSCQRRSIPQLHGKTVAHCNFGWLVLLDKYSDDCFLFNPTSMLRIQLPPCGSLRSQEYYCLLTAPPTDSNCVILFSTNPADSIVSFQFLKLGDTRWSFQDLQFPSDSDQPGIVSNLVSCQGKVYAHAWPENVFSLAVDAGTITVEDLKMAEIPWQSRLPGFSGLLIESVESCGEVFRVEFLIFGFLLDPLDIFYFRVLKLDFSRNDWVEVKSIGDRAFFITAGLRTPTNFSCSTKHSNIRGNTIYFTLPQDKTLYAFHLEEESITTYMPCPAPQSDCSRPIWLLAHSHSLTSVDKLQLPSVLKAGNEKIIDDEQEETWSALPSELLSLISSTLSGPDTLNFNFVCKSWQSVSLLTPCTTQLIEPSKTLSDIPQFPLLLFLGRDDDRPVCNFYNALNNTAYTLNVPEIGNARVRFSKNGWLLMSRGDIEMFFLNPLTKQRIDLPELNTSYKFHGVSFSAPPTSSDCVVLGVYTGYLWDQLCITFIRHGETDWTCFELNEYSKFIISHSNPVFYDGLFYCLGRNGRLGTFDPQKDDETGWTLLPSPENPCVSSRRNYLIECNGDLLSVFEGSSGKYIKVFKLDKQSMSWQKVDSLGDETVLFVSRTTSFSAQSKAPRIGNKVFFPRFRDGYCDFYSLVTNKFHCLKIDMARDDFYGTTEKLHCGWFEPNFQTHSDEELQWCVYSSDSDSESHSDSDSNSNSEEEN